MGKPTGFMEYNRHENECVSCAERIKNFDEFHEYSSKEERKKQGARCMNCGVPFCQSGMILNNMMTGCPLNNLIPEWNDEIYKGNDKQAAARLLKTNNFPEFTGRVCPALCEAACTCAMNGDAVTIKDNELYIIETAYKNGYITPAPPEVRTDKKIAVIGSGPAGLAVADQLNKRGHNVTVFEKNDRVGGLLMYGIPNMKLDKSVIDRKVDIMRKEGIKFVIDCDASKKSNADKILKEYDAVVLCCGAGVPRDIKADGRDAKNIYFAVDFLTQNTKSLLNSNFADKKFPDVTNKDVVIIGGGDTGNDCVGTCIRHGAKSVVQLEMMGKPPVERTLDNPWPEYPKTLKTDYGQQEAIAVFGHDPRVYNTTVKEFKKDKNGNLKSIVTVKVGFKKVDGNPRPEMYFVENSEKEIKADVLIIAAGFLGTDKKIADAFKISLDERLRVKTQNGKYKTNADKVFTAGDMHMGQSLVVRAIAEGRRCAREIDEFLMGYTNMI